MQLASPSKQSLNDNAIVCEELSKVYNTSIGSKFALNNLSFQVKFGEVVGIVGRNGCGKSTLLKVISGIIKPSKGKITINGQLISILEVGTGFIPELSGFDNVRLVCRLFGLTKRETKALLPSIIDFSELEAAMAEPVKNYSQGMYLRLAAAVAFSLKADIYLFDEVIAVGDEAFQKKCTNKFQQLTLAGSTILVVSHNFSQIVSICSRCILLKDGAILVDDKPGKVFEIFENTLYKRANITPSQSVGFTVLLDGHVDILHFNLSKNSMSKRLTQESQVEFDIIWKKKLSGISVCFHIDIKNEAGILLLNTANIYGKHREAMEQQSKEELGVFQDRCTIPSFFLNHGCYFAYLKCTSYDSLNNYRLIAESEYPLSVHIENFHDETRANIWTFTPAPIRTKLDWTRKSITKK